MLAIKEGEKIVNLDNVSNINIVEKEEGGKIFFNMNHSIRIFGTKLTSDYIAWKYNSKSELGEILASISTTLNKWIQPSKKGERFLNPKSVSSIYFDDYNLKAVFNLNFAVSSNTDNSDISSAAYYDFDTEDEFNQFKEDVINLFKGDN
jgi:hypothetical protein